MTAPRRSGVTLVELLVAVSIIGILTGLAAPTVVGMRRAGKAQQALTELRAVDIAVNASCGRGICGPFMATDETDATATTVPDVLKEFLPSGFEFSHDTATYALELESWQSYGNAGYVAPVCHRRCRRAWAVATTGEDPGFTNTAGFATPPTISVTVTIVTRDGAMAQQLYDKAGGTPPVQMLPSGIWKFSYPILVAVPATG